MKARLWIGLTAVLLLLAAIAFCGYDRWGGRNRALRDEALALVPNDASAVLFADFEELRQAPFLSALYAWAPKPQADADYAQFQQATGFNYERDLDLVCIALLKHGPEVSYFAVADGRFDRRKIAAYALQPGARFSQGNLEIFSIPVNGSARKISFAFLRTNRIALTNENDLSKILAGNQRDSDASDWRTRFERLAGSPIFAVIRHEAGTASALAEQAPGGLRSPQLSAVLEQLQWMTLAGKPDADRLRIVVEGEGTSDTTAQQLSDLLNGILVLMQAGLNDSKTRKQLDPVVREAYLELVKGAEVSRIDRGETKAVRMVFEMTPKFLEAARIAAPIVPPIPANDAAAKKGERHK
ncbi:MAG: hypothetical protein ACHQLQ_14235 [Candidatus Acidiferrales bacterium]